jgi:hypothetical protein
MNSQYEKYTTTNDNEQLEREYENRYKLFREKNKEDYSQRYSLFKELCPLVKDLMCTVYLSFDQFMLSSQNPHPFEEYLISLDECMPDNHMVRTIAQRMGFIIPNTDDRAYEGFVNDIVELIKYSELTNDEYSTIINMNRKDFIKKMMENSVNYHYDDRLFAFAKIKATNNKYTLKWLQD